MNPVRIEDATHALGKPANWDDETAGRCSTLWVRAAVEDGVPFMFSAWEAAPDEALCLLAGAKMRLGISGQSHPVVNVAVGPLPDDLVSPLIVERVLSGQVPAVLVSMLSPEKRRIYCQAIVGEDGLGMAIKTAVDEIERFVRDDGAAK